MIKGLVITPPVLGRISIGRVTQLNDKRIPVKDDQFTITSQIQNKEGWLLHPYDQALRQSNAHQKLRSIPVTVLFGEADLNLRADYSLFDRQTGRLTCVGNGETCRRQTDSGVQTLACPSPQYCELSQGGKACKLYGRLNVLIAAGKPGEGNEDELGTFVFRTTGYNSVRTLSARLRYFQAVSGDRLASMPLEIKLRGKSTTMSRGTPIYYADLTVRDGLSLQEAISQAHQKHQDRVSVGFDQKALDQAGRQGFANGGFEETDEDAADVAEEFFPQDLETTQRGKAGTEATAQAETPIRQTSLKHKLALKASRVEDSSSLAAPLVQ